MGSESSERNMKELCAGLALRFPQLTFQIAEGISKSEEYRDAVLRGKLRKEKTCFLDPEGIRLELTDTPAGQVEVLFLPKREDFLYAYRALAYRCEPEQIPDSVGACILDGLVDWEKIRNHQREYEAQGGMDWPTEFRKFTAERENFRGILILLSGGYYSAISPDRVSMTQKEWMEKSYVIRKNHELCHFVCRKCWPEKKEKIRDEVYADCIGLIAAFGKYDSSLAKLFLGLEESCFREGGRLSHYADNDLLSAIRTANSIIEEIEQKLAARPDLKGLWETLSAIYP